MINKCLFIAFILVCLISCRDGDSNNTLSGCWLEIDASSEIKVPIVEVQFNKEGEFSVTNAPFETFKSYWGNYKYNKFNQTTSLTITGGNTIPGSVDLNGSLIINNDNELILSDMYLGDFSGGIVSIPDDIIYTFKNVPDFCVGR